jgi:hypothetical protein
MAIARQLNFSTWGKEIVRLQVWRCEDRQVLAIEIKVRYCNTTISAPLLLRPPEELTVPFLTVCPDCRQAQVCVLPAKAFPRLMCVRCRAVYDPIGNEDTEVIPELAGVAVANAIERRKNRRLRRSSSGQVTKTLPRRVDARPIAGNVSEAFAASILAMPVEQSSLQSREIKLPRTASKQMPVATSKSPTAKRRKRDADGIPPLPAGSLATGAICLTSVAVLLASLNVLPFLAKPLLLLGALISFWAICSAIRQRDSLRLASTAFGLAVTIALASFLIPGLLGQKFALAASNSKAVSDIEVLPHPQFVSDPKVRSDEWVDASKATVIIRGTRVEVIGMSFSPNRDGQPGERILSVSVVVSRRQAGSPPTAAPLTWNPAIRATLRSSDGNVAESIDPSGNTNESSKSSPSSELLVVFKFPIYTLADGDRRLQIPASGWGDTGLVKFTLPRSLADGNRTKIR